MSAYQTMNQAERLLIQPRSGVSDHGRMKFQTRWLDRAGADIATATIDAYTRQQDWAHAATEANLAHPPRLLGRKHNPPLRRLNKSQNWQCGIRRQLAFNVVCYCD